MNFFLQVTTPFKLKQDKVTRKCRQSIKQKVTVSKIGSLKQNNATVQQKEGCFCIHIKEQPVLCGTKIITKMDNIDFVLSVIQTVVMLTNYCSGPCVNRKSACSLVALKTKRKFEKTFKKTGMS